MSLSNGRAKKANKPYQEEIRRVSLMKPGEGRRKQIIWSNFSTGP